MLAAARLATATTRAPSENNASRPPPSTPRDIDAPGQNDFGSTLGNQERLSVLALHQHRDQLALVIERKDAQTLIVGGSGGDPVTRTQSET